MRVDYSKKIFSGENFTYLSKAFCTRAISKLITKQESLKLA